jgi:hypothetical protein
MPLDDFQCEGLTDRISLLVRILPGNDQEFNMSIDNRETVLLLPVAVLTPGWVIV